MLGRQRADASYISMISIVSNNKGWEAGGEGMGLFLQNVYNVRLERMLLEAEASRYLNEEINQHPGVFWERSFQQRKQGVRWSLSSRVQRGVKVKNVVRIRAARRRMPCVTRPRGAC